MGQDGAKQLKGRLVAREAPNSYAGAEKPGRPQWQMPHRAVRGELDDREGTEGHDSDEQSVAGQAVYRTVFRRAPAAE